MSLIAGGREIIQWLWRGIMGRSDLEEIIEPKPEGDSSFPFAAIWFLLAMCLFGTVLFERVIVVGLQDENSQITDGFVAEHNKRIDAEDTNEDLLKRCVSLNIRIMDLQEENQLLKANKLVPVPDPGFQRWSKDHLEFTIDPKDLRPLTEAEFEALKEELRSQKNDTPPHELSRQTDGSGEDEGRK